MNPVLLDQNFSGRIADGLRRRLPGLVVHRAWDFGLEECSDDELIEIAAEQDWSVLTHDESTFSIFVRTRAQAGLPFCRVAVVPQDVPIRAAIDGLALLLEAGDASDWPMPVRWIPLR